MFASLLALWLIRRISSLVRRCSCLTTKLIKSWVKFSFCHFKGYRIQSASWANTVLPEDDILFNTPTWVNHQISTIKHKDEEHTMVNYYSQGEHFCVIIEFWLRDTCTCVFVHVYSSSHAIKWHSSLDFWENLMRSMATSVAFLSLFKICLSLIGRCS